ncbi:thiolase family protein [Bacillus sp. JJ1533]|uniref:thiolase family protein n=1 Tax=Bacillus sp. JJ1533 TaxID=3122959 RepID=UPI002FFF7AE2
MSNRDPVIVSAVRTAIAKKGGTLAKILPHQFGAIVIREVINRVNIPAEIVDDVIIGNLLSGGGNIARLTVLQAGLPLEVPGLTIDRQCGSGLNAIMLAAQAIKAGDGEIFIAGGVESMTRAPYLLEPPSRAYSPKPPEFRELQVSTKEIGNPPMGITAENLAKRYNISRDEQDEYAYRSQMRMANAVSKGYFQEQIISIDVPTKTGFISFHSDEHPRPETSLEALAKLKPAFKDKGTVTAGNSSGLNDAASALVVMSRGKAMELGIKPLAVIRDYSISAVDPNIMGIGPVPAIRKLLKKSNMNINNIDLIELNEAFAAQVIACDRELEFDSEKLNVNGGAIAHGHPLGATGAILTTKAIYELHRTKKLTAIISACIGGGQGIAALIEREE